MGAWGYQLFNSDNEFDVVISDIDEQARKLAKDPKLTLYEPKNKKRVVKKLNDDYSTNCCSCSSERNGSTVSVLAPGNPSFRCHDTTARMIKY